MTRIACAQLAPEIGELADNCDRSVTAVRAAVARGADVVVLPELATSGYVFRDREEAARLAITPDHSLFEEWARNAGDCLVIGGFCELGANGAVYNSAAVVDESGVLAVYRKTHLWDRERLVFTAGNEPPPVLDTRVGRLGVLICYDLEFPELTRKVALAGAQLLAVPTNWPLRYRPADERPAEVVIAMATARMNRMSIACCDRTGTERGQRWTAGTAIVDPDGWVAAVADGDGVACADVDLAHAMDKRLSDYSDAFADRRPLLYDGLSR